MTARGLVLLAKGGGTGGGLVRVASDVRYSSIHKRNVLDVYQRGIAPPADGVTARGEKGGDMREGQGGSDASRPGCWVLFVHGGMWLRGDKSRPTLSAYDIVSSVYSGGLLGGEEAGDRHRSNVGRTVAAAGGVGCVMNYRLASPVRRGGGDRNNPGPSNNDRDEGRNAGRCGGHPDQVMDVARCIAFLSHKMPPGGRLFVGGHSAGAHLAALALADTKYLDAAFAERGLGDGDGDGDGVARGYDDLIGGFFGLGGVYNLPRLGMDPIAAPLTVGPAFGADADVLRDASPLHALLRTELEVTRRPRGRGTGIPKPPPLARVPVLLLNAAGNDWGLARDSEELLVALGRFDRVRGVDGEDDGDDDSSPMPPPPMRSHHLISSRNHFSIERMFGEGVERFLRELPRHQRQVQKVPFDDAARGRDDGDSPSRPIGGKVMSTEGEARTNDEDDVVGQGTQTGWYDALLASGGRIAGGYLPDPSEWYVSAVGYVWPRSSPPSTDVGGGGDKDGDGEKNEDVDEAAVLVLRFLGLIPPPPSPPDLPAEAPSTVTTVTTDDEGKVGTGDGRRH